MAHFGNKTEAAFVHASLREFIFCWQSRKKATLSLECSEGKASLNLSFNLGHPGEIHAKSKRNKSRKTPSRIRRDKDRAIKFQNSVQSQSNLPQTSAKRQSTSTVESLPKRAAINPVNLSSGPVVQLPAWDNQNHHSQEILRDIEDHNTSLTADLVLNTHRDDGDDQDDDVEDEIYENEDEYAHEFENYDESEDNTDDDNEYENEDDEDDDEKNENANDEDEEYKRPVYLPIVTPPAKLWEFPRTVQLPVWDPSDLAIFMVLKRNEL